MANAPIGWHVLPIPPYVVCRTGKMGQDLQEITVICLNLPIFQAVFLVLAMQEVSKPWLLSRSINHPLNYFRGDNRERQK